MTFHALFVGDPQAFHLQHDRARGREPYHRLLGAALRGDPSLFSRQDGLMEAWRIVDGILTDVDPVIAYRRGTWGPVEADRLLPHGGAWATP